MKISPHLEAQMLAAGAIVRPAGSFGLPPLLPLTVQVACEVASEKEFMAEVVKMAKSQGWMVYHTHDSRRSESGFPDLVLVRKSRLIFAELKFGKNQATPAQQKWIDSLADAMNQPGCVFLWRPEDWNLICETLK